MTIRPSFLRAVLFVLALSVAAPVTAQAEELRSISVQGNGSVAAKPDTAAASAGIESRGASPDEALAANTKAMNAILAALKRYGIAERDIETSSFNVSPIYAQQQGPRGAPTIDGYQVSNVVSARIRDMSKLGGLLTSLIEAGANRIHGVAFEIADSAPLMDRARKAAVADARARADLYAAAAGVKVKRVISIQEAGGYAPPMPVVRAMKAGADAVPVQGGEQTVNATVSVVYEIE